MCICTNRHPVCTRLHKPSRCCCSLSLQRNTFRRFRQWLGEQDFPLTPWCVWMINRKLNCCSHFLVVCTALNTLDCCFQKASFCILFFFLFMRFAPKPGAAHIKCYPIIWLSWNSQITIPLWQDSGFWLVITGKHNRRKITVNQPTIKSTIMQFTDFNMCCCAHALLSSE